MKTLLIPTDFSENARNAITYAMHFAQKEECRLHLFHAAFPPVVSPYYTFGDQEILNTKLALDEDRMKILVEATREALLEMGDKNTKVSSKIEVGSAISGIREEVESCKPDLIVIGSQGSNHSLNEKVFGSVASALIQKAEAPVILVPLSHSFEGIERVLYASAAMKEDPFELWKASQIIDGFKPIYRCLHVSKDADTEKFEEMKKYAAANSKSPHTIFETVQGDNVEKQILDSISKNDIQLLILYHRELSIMERLFSKSMSKSLAYKVDIPMLVMR